MLTQTLAIFHDAYRELNAKRMFWVVLVLSGLIVAAFAMIGVQNNTLTLLGYRTPIPIPWERGEFFLYLFSVWGIGLWLGLGATVLALISTAGIFPEFVSGGAIDLYVSKPMSRLRLFATKYAAALLFVGLQVAVFAAESFLVLGWRGGVWEPRVFLAVPIVVCFFSYLYCVCVLVGIVTRSTVAAILLTVLFWFVVFLLHITDVGLVATIASVDRQTRGSDMALKAVDGQIAYMEKLPPDRRADSALALADAKEQRQRLLSEREEIGGDTIRLIYRYVYRLKTVLPKTSETTNLLNRWLLSEDTLIEEDDDDRRRDASTQPRRDGRRRRDAHVRDADVATMQRAVNERPVSWVIGTSLAFETVVLGLAAFVFCRRDY